MLYDEVIADSHARSLPALTQRRIQLPWLQGKVDALVQDVLKRLQDAFKHQSAHS